MTVTIGDFLDLLERDHGLPSRHNAECPPSSGSPSPAPSSASTSSGTTSGGADRRGIGDVTSDAKGTGARFNDGKPDLSLIPLVVLALSFNSTSSPVVQALNRIGQFQRTHEVTYLYHALGLLGDAGWEECAHVFTYGKRKYAAWNWAKGMPWSVPLACAARHLIAMTAGETDDPESGLPHRGHVFCNVLMLIQYANTYPEGNDLPPKGLL